MPHFQLCTIDGEALGPVELGRPDWPPGSVIYRGGDEPNLRVLDKIVSDDPEKFDVLVVAADVAFFDGGFPTAAQSGNTWAVAPATMR